MEEKVLEMLEPDVLNKSFNNHGREVPFKNYLIKEVFPYMDLTNETIKLKSGFVVSLKDFFEQSILYTCQNKYEGDFVSFAKDNIISFEEGKKRVEKKRFSNVTGNLSPTAKIYPFFEYLDGPQYQVIVDKGKVFFSYKDENFDVVMKSVNDQKDFLKRIKRLDLPFFIKIYTNNPVFKDYVGTFKSDEEFFEDLMTGVEIVSDFDKEIEKKIGEITGLIEEVENSQISTASTKTGVFSIEDLPNFDVDTCIKTIISKCTSYYSEFSSDVDESLSSNSVLEKADYITREYLQTKVDKLFYDYVSEIANSVNNDLDLDINEEFISSNLDKIMSELRKQLKRLFVYPYRDKEADSSDVYINVIAASLENQITFYEQLVNSTIENKLALFGYVLRGQEEAPIQTR
ncbi:MAG: hypothetical protein OSJ65_02405 [Bacilli bacterium]|nr:hypothetical protein [Bacilli bacterium]